MQTFVVVIEGETCRLGSLDDDAATTLIAVCSEDPACWDDVAAYWPRYQTPPVPEFADGMSIEPVDSATARQALDGYDEWVVIDLIEKRIFTGRETQPIGRDQVFAMVVDDSDQQHCPLSVHLPPWWEMHEHSDADAIDRSRLTPLVVPQVNREVLFGEPLVNDLAARILEVIDTQQWNNSEAMEMERARYDFIVQVHRDWLMTPRQDLNGRTPRQLLHGAHEWIDRLVWAQRLRFEDGGEVIAAPTCVVGYDNAPMGSEEMIMYFDLCRELISAGWEWCADNQRVRKKGSDIVAGTTQQVLRRTVLGGDVRAKLAEFLADVKQQWLNSRFEGGSPPRFIIECSRRRVPRGVGVPIVGMTERETKQHVIDCDCPICNMDADGMFGPSFAGIDGHHLELDDEFAFSMHETREAWEEQQREFAQLSDEIEREKSERDRSAGTEQDEFASAWSGQMSDGPLPGDSQGHVKLAFLLAEIIGLLKSASAPHQDIKQLNDRFTDFRRCDRVELAACGKQLGEHLEDVARRYPELISRVADLQSRIDEQVRSPAFDDDVRF